MGQPIWRCLMHITYVVLATLTSVMHLIYCTGFYLMDGSHFHPLDDQIHLRWLRSQEPISENTWWNTLFNPMVVSQVHASPSSGWPDPSEVTEESNCFQRRMSGVIRFVILCNWTTECRRKRVLAQSGRTDKTGFQIGPMWKHVDNCLERNLIVLKG